MARIEDAGLNASAPTQQRVFDGWLLRFSPGKAKRARCINAIGAGRLPLADKLAFCERAYAQAALPLVVRITPFSEPPRLDEALATMGMHCLDDTRVMLLPDLRALTTHALPGMKLHEVSCLDFAQTVGAMRGSSALHCQAHAERLHHAPVRFRGFVVRQDGEAVACAQYALEADLAGLYDVFTLPTARGQGIARETCARLLIRARSEGAQRAYLQVEGDNEPARAAYHRLGFADAYAYHYRTRDTQFAPGWAGSHP